MSKILVAAKCEELGRNMVKLFAEQGHETTRVGTMSGTHRHIRRTSFDIVFVDRALVWEDVMHEAQNMNARCEVIPFTFNVGSTVEAVRLRTNEKVSTIVTDLAPIGELVQQIIDETQTEDRS